MDSLIKAVKDAYAAKQVADDKFDQALAEYPQGHPNRDDAEETCFDASSTLQRACEALAFYVCHI